jgi:CO/xanthine dehydrogenase FAD-binding subunit
MIPGNFAYYRPDTIKEAVQCYETLASQGKKVFYYAGGSEIISMARAGSIQPDSVIDLKAIADCQVLEPSKDQLVIGSAVSLTKIANSKLFPLLGTTVGRIADHTNQCRITLGGNLCGTIIYRETSLPLLLTDSYLLLFGPEGPRQAAFKDVFQQRLMLKPGEMVVQVHIPKEYLNVPYLHIKKTKSEKIDYPLLTVAGLKYQNKIRLAISGLCPFPFRALSLEAAFNEGKIPDQDQLLCLLPAPPLYDLRGSAAYRLFVLHTTLESISQRWEEL